MKNDLCRILKANPYHDARGRFTHKAGAKSVSRTGVFAGKVPEDHATLFRNDLTYRSLGGVRRKK